MSLQLTSGGNRFKQTLQLVPADLIYLILLVMANILLGFLPKPQLIVFALKQLYYLSQTIVAAQRIVIILYKNCLPQICFLQHLNLAISTQQAYQVQFPILAPSSFLSVMFPAYFRTIESIGGVPLLYLADKVY